VSETGEHASVRRTEIEQRLQATDAMPSSNLVAAMYSDDVRWLLERWDEVQVAESDAHVQGQLLAHVLADCVVKATEYGEQDGGFVASYIMPTGPLHRAIPLLAQHGIDVRPGFDGRKEPTLRVKPEPHEEVPNGDL
jgi:hypothetical protein